MLRVLWLCSVACAFTIVSFNSEGPSRSNRSTFPIRLQLSEPINLPTINAISIIQGDALRTRADMSPNLDYDTRFTVAISNISLSASGSILSFSATVTPPSPSVELPFLLQVATNSLQSARNTPGPDAARDLVLIYDSKGPTPNVTSLMGEYSNRDAFPVGVLFGERVANFTLDDVTIIPGVGMNYSDVTLALLNQTNGQFLITLLGLSGEGPISLAVRPVADVVGNINGLARTVTIIRDVTPAVIALTSDAGPNVKGDSFAVSINSSEPLIQFEAEDLMITIAQGRGAAGLTPLQNRTSDNTSFGLNVQGIAPAAATDGSYAPNLTVSVQVREGSVSDRAGNLSPLKDSPGRVLLVVVDVSGQNVTVIPNARSTPVVVSDSVQRVGSISLGGLIGIVVALAALLVCCCILMCLKRRKEHNEAPDAFKRYGRKVYAEYGVPPTPAGLTEAQIVHYGIVMGYDEPRSKVAAERLLKAADKNGDGLLSEEEFLAWLAKVIHQQNKTKVKTPLGQDRRITHRDVLTLKKTFPLQSALKNKQMKRVGVSPPGLVAASSSSEADPMLQKPISVHV